MSNQVADSGEHDDIEMTKMEMDQKIQPASGGGLARSTTTKMSDNAEVREELIRQTAPLKLTEFFIKRPCISIWTPFILLFLITFIVGAAEMIDPAQLNPMDDSWYILDDEKLMNRDIMNVAHWSLNRKKSGVDAKQELLEENQVRLDASMMSSIILMYEHDNDFVDVAEEEDVRKYGLLSKKAFQKVIELEFSILEWNAKSSNYKNKKFNDKEEHKVSWQNMCFAGRDAEENPREPGIPACRDPESYMSAVILFTDAWEKALNAPSALLCGVMEARARQAGELVGVPEGVLSTNELTAQGGPLENDACAQTVPPSCAFQNSACASVLAQYKQSLDQGTLKNFHEQFMQFYLSPLIKDEDIQNLLIQNMVNNKWASYQALFDSKVSSTIRNKMYDLENLKCLNKVEGDPAETERIAKEKLAGYKKLKKSDHYMINYDFFQIDRINPLTNTPTAAYKPCFTREQLVPKISFFMSRMVYGTPFVAQALNKVDKDVGRLDEDRQYPTDQDRVYAFITDVVDHAETNFDKDTSFCKTCKNKVGFTVRIDSFALTIERFTDLIAEDGQKAFFSIMFVWAYLSAHMQSYFLSCLGMSIVLLSFPATIFLTNAILQVKYFGFMQVIIIYIVLGIAADDIFVFYDAYQQSAEMDKKAMDTTEKRLAYSFRRSARAMAITSSTTAVAFFATSISPIMQVSAFGLFAGVIVPVNYLLVIMIFPPAVIWYERTILAKKEDGSWKYPFCICYARCKREKAEHDEHGNKLAKLGMVERFFDTKINDCLSNLVVRIVIIILSVAWIAISIYMTSQLSKMTKQPDPVDPDHEVLKTFNMIKDHFEDKEGGSGQKTGVNFIWGVTELDRTEVPSWNVTWKGNATFDNSFSENFWRPENQEFMLKGCYGLQGLEGTATRTDADGRDVTVNCWSDRFVSDFLMGEPVATGNTDLTGIWGHEFEACIALQIYNKNIKPPTTMPPGLDARAQQWLTWTNAINLVRVDPGKYCPELWPIKVMKSDGNGGQILDETNTKLKLYDLLMQFVQAKSTMELNGGAGLLESYVGIDYATIKQNDEYQLKPPPSKNVYIQEPGLCVKPKPAANRRRLQDDPVVFDNNVPGLCTGNLVTTNRKTGDTTGSGTINFEMNGDGSITGTTAYTSASPQVEGEYRFDPSPFASQPDDQLYAFFESAQNMYWTEIYSSGNYFYSGNFNADGSFDGFYNFRDDAPALLADKNADVKYSGAVKITGVTCTISTDQAELDAYRQRVEASQQASQQASSQGSQGSAANQGGQGSASASATTSPTPTGEFVQLASPNPQNPTAAEFAMLPADAKMDVNACRATCNKYDPYCNGYMFVAGRCTLISGQLTGFRGSQVGTGLTGNNLDRFPPPMYDGTGQPVPGTPGTEDLTGVNCFIKQRPNPNDCKYQKFLLPSQMQSEVSQNPNENLNCRIKTQTDVSKIMWPAVRYVKMDISMMVGPGEPASIKEPFVAQVDGYCNDINGGANTPAGLKNLKQASQGWIFMPSEDELVKGAIQGIILALAFSTVVILVATQNIINTVFAILSVGMVIISILGVYYAKDYEFGMNESLAIVVLIGFAVDYIIHYSAEYMHSMEDNRQDKMRQSLRQMGVSILSGYLTTLGSGIFLLTCDMIFFQRFGETIALAVTFAFLFATFFYASLMKTAGPVGNCGNVFVCLKRK